MSQASTDLNPESSSSSRRGLVAMLLVTVPFSQIPLDTYTPAMPDMVRELATSASLIENTVTVYMLGMALALIPVGMLSDAFGRKKILLSGLTLLVLTSVACGLAQNVSFLIALRFIQGIAGCTGLVVTFAIAADCFRGTKLISVSGLLGVAWGLAPVLAPAAGGIIVQYVSWRMIFFGIAVLAGIVGLILLFFLPETLAVSNRSPIRLRETLSTIVGGLRNTRFMSYALVFALAGSVQIVFGVAAPFLYQERLRFSPAAYGLIALLVGAANLMGEVACSALAQRTTPRQLCFGAWSFLAVGALVMALSGTFSGPGFLAITVASCLSLAGGGTLCPTMYGMGLGLFSRNLGLMGGMISAICYLGISASTAVVAHLPQNTQAPLGWLYVTLGIFVFILLFFSLPRAKEDQATASKPA